MRIPGTGDSYDDGCKDEDDDPGGYIVTDGKRR